MRRPTVALLATALIATGCDLPTSAEEARERLGRDQEERIVPLQLPLPELAVTLAEQFGDLSEIVDTTDLSFRVDPDTFAIGLDSLLVLDPVDPDPVTQGYDIEVADFSRDINVALPAVPIALPSTDTALPLAPITPGGSINLPVDLSGAFTDATFVTGSAFQVVLSTDGVSSIDSVSAAIEDSGGSELAAAPGTVTLGPSQTDTLVIDLGGVTLPATFDLVLAFTSGSGDGGDNLGVNMTFVGAEVVAATGVDAARVTTVSFSETVALDQTGADFSEATLDSGTVAVDSFSSGTLAFTADFDGDLAGLRVGGTTPDSLVVAGDVGPPAGAGTVDVESSASLTIGFTGLKVRSVTLDSVSMAVDQTLAIAGTDTTLNDLAQITIASGALQIDVTNRLGVGGPIDLTLTGAVDASGSVITSVIDLQPSPDGTPTVTSTTVDLAGAVLTPDSLEPRVAGTISGTDVTVTPEAAAEAVTVDPFLDIQPQQVVLSGVPDLAVTLDERIPIAAGDIALDQLSELLGGLEFNDVSFTVTLDNGTGLDMRVDAFRMTLLDSIGSPIADGADTARVELRNDASGAVLIPAASVTVVEGAANRFVNMLLDEIAAGRDVEIAASGNAGPGADSGSVSLGDSLTVIFEIGVGPDITIDPAGIVFDQIVIDALDLEASTAEYLTDLSEDLVSAVVEFEAVNGMPLGMSVRMALAPSPAPADSAGWDPFAEDPNIDLPEFSFGAGAVDSTGRVEAPTTDTATASVDPADFAVLEAGQLGMGIEATIAGPTGGRAVLQPTDSLVLRPLLKLEIRVTGGAGGNQ